MGKSKPIEYRIDSNGCFICTSHCKDKYGYIKIATIEDGKRIYTSAHRLIYKQMFGYIERNIVVMHKCDNRACINPEHLQAGTHKENMQDMVNKGRNKGKKIRLTEDAVRDIRTSSKTITQLANKYGVNVATIKQAKNGHTYKNVI